MSYFPLLSNPFKPEYISFVDLGGIEPPSKQHILGHAKILFDVMLSNHATSLVNPMMISHRIRFKAIFSRSKAFSNL